MITFKVGDLMKFTESAFGHGCNCQKTMGSGVAKAVKDTYPELTFVDKMDARAPIERLGEITTVKLKNGKRGYNLYSQFEYFPRGICHLDYDALESALIYTTEDMIKNGLQTLALPKIGAGLAGGDWNRILPILERQSKSSAIDFYIYTLG